MDRWAGYRYQHESDERETNTYKTAYNINVDYVLHSDFFTPTLLHSLSPCLQLFSFIYSLLFTFLPLFALLLV